MNQNLKISVENLEHVWPSVVPNLGKTLAAQAADRQAKQNAANAEVRATLIPQLLRAYEAAFRAQQRRTGDVQANVGRTLDRETERLKGLTVDQLRAEMKGLEVDNTAAVAEKNRLMGLGVTDLRIEAAKQNPPQTYQPPRQAYGNQNVSYKPLPATYNGLEWTYRLLYKMEPRELDRLMKEYGPALDRAVAANKAKGIR